MMNEQMLELMRKGFEVEVSIEWDGRCIARIRNVKLDKSARGYSGYSPEQALANCILAYIDGHGRIE